MPEFSGRVAFAPDGCREARAELSYFGQSANPDPQRGETTAAAASGRVLLFDGYLFDRTVLASEHGIPRALPDARAALAWLERFGAETLARLRGDYTLACWDPNANHLLLVSAPMANRLVYYFRRGPKIWFASALPGLFCDAQVPHELDPLQLALALINQTLSPQDTVYRDIRLVPTGTLLSITAATVCETALWRPDTSRRLHLRRHDDYVEAGRHVLTRAVAQRLPMAGNAAVMLSAGLDSAAIAATAAMLALPSSLQAYTAVPAPGGAVPEARGWYADERAGVSEIARRHSNIVVTLCPSDQIADIERDSAPLFQAARRPYPILNHLAWFDPLYRKAIADGHRILLTGGFGNFTLSFDGLRGLSDLALQGRIGTLARLLPALSRSTNTTITALLARHVLAPALPPSLRDTIARFREHSLPWSRIGALNDNFARSIALDERLWQAGVDAGFRHPGGSRAVLAHFAFLRRMQTVENIQALRAYHGIEHRDPLADADLVDFCLSLPREQFLLGGTPRAFARRVLADRLPHSIVANPARGQQNPHWYCRLSAQREAFAQDLEQFARVPLAAALLDLPRLRTLLSQWPADALAANLCRYEYESLLPRAIQIGRFICWSEAEMKTGQER